MISVDLPSLIGDKLLVHRDGSFVEESSSVLSGKTAVLYFSANWCGPCRDFTSILKERYAKLQEKHIACEVVYVSRDNNQEEFEEHCTEMPWAAIPYTNQLAIETIECTLNLQRIPTLMVVGPDGQLLNSDATVMVVEDDEAVEFPWEPVTRLGIGDHVQLAPLLGSTLLAHNGDEIATSSALAGKTVGLYLAGHWQGACRDFTAVLKERYGKLREQGTAFEVVYVSRDHSKEEFEESLSGMPWAAVLYANQKAIKTVKRSFTIRGLPALIIVGPGGEVLNDAAVQMVTQDEKLQRFPWRQVAR